MHFVCQVETPAEIEVVVLDSNDNKPVFDATSLAGSVFEDQTSGWNTLITVLKVIYHVILCSAVFISKKSTFRYPLCVVLGTTSALAALFMD